MINNAYSEKLKDPRWQKKRLEILQRDNWACQSCFDNESTLHVHHRRYIPNIQPWEYPNELLITLCVSCHESECLNFKRQYDSLIEQLQNKFLAEDIQELTIGIHCLELTDKSYTVAGAIGWAIADIKTMQYILNKYDKYLIKNHLKE
jgi:hypothetical protein